MFKKSDLTKVAESISVKILRIALTYRMESATPQQVSDGLGSEICFFLIHWVDRCAVRLTSEDRSKLLDEIITIVLIAYLNGIGITSTSAIRNNRSQLIDVLNERQFVYGQCSGLVGDDPLNLLAPGTLFGALGYYLRHYRGEVGDLDNGQINGKYPISEDEFDSPGAMLESVTLVPFLNQSIESLDLQAEFAKLGVRNTNQKYTGQSPI